MPSFSGDSYVGKRGQPSTPSYSATSTPNGPAWLRSPVGLGKAVAVLLGLVVAGDLFALDAGVTVYDVMGSLADDGVPYAAYGTVRRDAAHADSLYAAAGYIQTASLLATAVVYLVWFQRVRINAEVFNPFGHDHEARLDGRCWFVPIVSLWFPRRIMLDIWDASIPPTPALRTGSSMPGGRCGSSRSSPAGTTVRHVQSADTAEKIRRRRRPGAVLRCRRHRGRRARRSSSCCG